MRNVRTLTAALALLGVAACGDDAPDPGPAGTLDPVVAFDSTTAYVVTSEDTLVLSAEVASTAAQRAHGLMERDHLPEDAGMLFLYDEPQDAQSAFYMFRTRIPLDIAFLDDDGAILAILPMEPCPSPNPRSCRRYGPGQPFRAALEVNQGWFGEHGVAEGDTVRWDA